MATEWNEFNDLNISEFPELASETTGLVVNKTANETMEPPDNSAPTQGKKKSKLGGFAIKMLATSLVATTAAVGMNIQANAVEVEFVELEAYQTAIYYQIDVEPTDSELVLIVKNDFTNREIPLSVGVNSGEIVDLVANMEYSLSVRNLTGIDTTVKTYTVRTQKEDPPVEPPVNPSVDSSMDSSVDPPVTAFYGFTYHPAVNAMGTFTFTTDFVDEYQLWSNLSVELVDDYGYGSMHMNIENAGTMYEMNLGNTQFATSKGTLSVWADVLQEDGTSVRKKLHEQALEFMQTRTYIQSVTFTPVDAWAEEAIAYVEYIDENGFWTDGTVYAILHGTDDTGLAGPLQGSGMPSYYPIYEGFCEGNTLLYELSVYIDNGEELTEVFVYSEEVTVKSADFDESSGIDSSSDYDESSGSDSSSDFDESSGIGNSSNYST